MATNFHSGKELKKGSKGTGQREANIDKVWLWKPGEEEEPSSWYIVQKPSDTYDYYLYADTEDLYCAHRLESTGVKFELIESFENDDLPEFRTVYLQSPKECRRRIVSAFSQLPRWISLRGYDGYGEYCKHMLVSMHFERRFTKHGKASKSWKGYQECWTYRKQKKMNEAFFAQVVDILERAANGLYEVGEFMHGLNEVDDSYLTERELKDYDRAAEFMKRNIEILRIQAGKIRYTEEGDFLPESKAEFEKTIVFALPFIEVSEVISDYFDAIYERVARQSGFFTPEDET